MTTLGESSAVGRQKSSRSLVAALIVLAAAAQSLGLVMKASVPLGGNDASRWCTVWALLERGTYAIDDCPWRDHTVDKVYTAAPRSRDGIPGGAGRFYSSKPPLLSTCVAGLLYPFRVLSGRPLDRPGAGPPAAASYARIAVVLLNVVPYLFCLILYARHLDRYAVSDWSWGVGLVAAAWGTQLPAFNEALNVHTVTAYAAFFALYAAVRIWSERVESGKLFAAAGLAAGLCACSELPAALFAVLLFGMLLTRSPRLTLTFFAPAAAIPCAAFLATQQAAMGTPLPVPAHVVLLGTDAYDFEGNYWSDRADLGRRTGLDGLAEPKWLYLANMLVGHHGVLTLTPIFLFSFLAAIALSRGGHRLTAFARLTIVLTISIVAFYTWATNNYGGWSQGMRWLFWLYPFWLILLPHGVEPAREDPLLRTLVLAALAVSVFTSGYALAQPWSDPWPLDAVGGVDI